MSLVVVFGRNGNVSFALGEEFSRCGIPFRQLGKEEVDFRDGGDAAIRALEAYKPKVIVNAAAFTQVDKAESAVEEAFLLNSVVPGRIAAWCAENDVPLIHYSTDYVFDGMKTTSWIETDLVNPLNVYGKSKLAGERALLSSGAHCIILRTSWLFCPRGNNFYITMHKLGRERQTLSVVEDQIGAPTYTLDIARATIRILDFLEKGQAPSGIYHICNQGYVSWYDFAKEIFAIEKAVGVKLEIRKVLPIKTSEYGAPAARPLNSCMDTSKIKEIFGIELRHWRNSLEECIRTRLNL